MSQQRKFPELVKEGDNKCKNISHLRLPGFQVISHTFKVLNLACYNRFPPLFVDDEDF